MAIIQRVHYMTQRLLETLLLSQSFDQFACLSDNVAALGLSGTFYVLLGLWAHEKILFSVLLLVN